MNKKPILVAIILQIFPTYFAHAVKTNNQVQVKTDNSYRYIKSNGIPNHAHGEFPNKRNPHKIKRQTFSFRVPLYPKKFSKAKAIGMNLFGVAINGIPFDPSAAEFWQRDRNSGWQYEALSSAIDLGLDDNNAHVQPNGSYHYHGIPAGLVTKQNPKRHSTIMGYAADGFPIYVRYGFDLKHPNHSKIISVQSSYRLKPGLRKNGPRGYHDGTFVQDYEFIPSLGDLDECNGRFGVTPDYQQGIYHYFITETFPVIPRCWKGTPDDSFMKKRHSKNMKRKPSHPKHPPRRHQR